MGDPLSGNSDIIQTFASENYLMHITNNKQTSTFEGQLPGGELATMQYRWLKGSMVLMHTIIPPEHRGHGYGDVLTRYVLDHIRAHHLKVIVYCPFVQKYMDKHPEDNDLIDTTHNR